MKGDIKIADSEVRKFRRWANQQSDELRTKGRNLIARATEGIATAAKENAPVNKEVGVGGGRLRSSVSTRYSEDKLASDISVNVEYAPYQEFGTGDKVSVPQGLEAYAMQFKGQGKRKVNMSPQPYFFKPVERYMKALLNELKKLGFK